MITYEKEIEDRIPMETWLYGNATIRDARIRDAWGLRKQCDGINLKKGRSRRQKITEEFYYYVRHIKYIA